MFTPDARGMRALASAFREHEEKDDERHEANLERFGELRVAAAGLKAQMRIVIALLTMTGGASVANLFHH